jgi:hypothetical protein
MCGVLGASLGTSRATLWAKTLGPTSPIAARHGVSWLDARTQAAQEPLDPRHYINRYRNESFARSGHTRVLSRHQ